MEQIHVLVAEDDRNILQGLIDTLESEGYVAIPAPDGEAAIKKFEEEKCDIVLLDIMMPKKSGYDVCRYIRSRDKEVPVIMLTAKGQEIDKVVGLELGADDYVTKPFGVHELLARIAALLRRSKRTARPLEEGEEGPKRFIFGSAEVDAGRYSATVGRKTFRISARELQLMRFFYAHPSEVLTRDRLLNAVWGIDYYGTTRTLDQHIAQLRKKVEPDPGKPRVITTVHGVGYQYKGT
ncbi:MAG: response regulator transcription factor [Desulfatiglans sp.]|nr:response regulator transcription factor [Thermodesulfobacteriota bacterium]MEE4353259.1 response regulator transcription factor [Desulfatiglans sp.]